MNNKPLTLTYKGNDSLGRPIYTDEINRLFCDTDPRKHMPPNIATKLNNNFDGEPDTPIGYIEKYRNRQLEFVPERVTW